MPGTAIVHIQNLAERGGRIIERRELKGILLPGWKIFLIYFLEAAKGRS